MAQSPVRSWSGRLFVRSLMLATLIVAPCLLRADDADSGNNWYADSFFLLHEDHHTQGNREVGRDADLEETSRLCAMAHPDVIQIHAKGNPGWTTYPSKIGHNPPAMKQDVLGIWRDVARRDGYRFSVYYNLGRDAEIMKRRPEWNRSGPDGSPRDRALCYHSGVSEQYIFPMVREIMHEYRPDGWWFDGSCFTVSTCYCDRCSERFQHETGIEQLPRNLDDPGWLQFKEMHRQIYRDCIEQLCDLIHEIDPDCNVAVNWAYSIRMPEKPYEGIGNLTGDIGCRVEGLSAEAHWYDTTGVPFDLMTTVHTYRKLTDDADGKAQVVCVNKSPQQIQQEMAIITANGGRYFAWDNPTAESKLRPERFEFMGKAVEPFLRARQPWCVDTVRLPDVSLLCTASQHYADSDQTPNCFARPDRRRDGAVQWLKRLQLDYEMTGDWKLLEQDVRGQMLLVEHPKKLTDEECRAIVRFVEQGGILLWTGMGTTRPEIAELLGIDSSTHCEARQPIEVVCGEQTMRFSHYPNRVVPTTGSTLWQAKTQSGSTFPLLTCNRFGKGRAYYVSIPLLTPHGEQCDPPETLVAHIFNTVLPDQQRRIRSSAPSEVEITLRKKTDADSYVAHLVNMSPGESEKTVIGQTHGYSYVTNIPPVGPSTLTVRVPHRPQSVRLQPQGEDVPGWSYKDGRLSIDVPTFAIHQMIVIEYTDR